LAAAAVDDQLLGPLGDLRVEVVHEHPLGRLLDPALRRALGSAGRLHGHVLAHVGSVPGGAGAPQSRRPRGAPPPRCATGSIIPQAPPRRRGPRPGRDTGGARDAGSGRALSSVRPPGASCDPAPDGAVGAGNLSRAEPGTATLATLAGPA